MADTKTYVVRLIDCGNVRGPGSSDSAQVGSDAVSVCSNLKTFYSAVCQKASSSTTIFTADVQWLGQPASTPSGGEAGGLLTINIIIFFVPFPRDSVILLHPNYNGKLNLDAITDFTQLGTTVTASRTPGNVPTLGISEVYIKRTQDIDSTAAAFNLARAAFHESMHNQLRKGDELHLGDGFAKAKLDNWGSSPSAANITAMAGQIGTLIPQWLDGFQEWIKWNRSRP
jgi:hypothetical protein